MRAFRWPDVPSPPWIDTPITNRTPGGAMNDVALAGITTGPASSSSTAALTRRVATF